MPARFNLYSAWIDPKFYGWAALFAAALFLLVYSLRRFLALRRLAAFSVEELPQPEAGPEPEPEAERNPFLEEPAAALASAATDAPAEAPEQEKTLVLAPGEQQAFLAAAEAAQAAPAQEEQPAPEEPAPAAVELPAEVFAEAAPEAAPEAAAEPVLEAAPQPAPAARQGEEHGAAENFVRGIYAGISDLDERMKTIEAALSKGHVNNDFTVKFLEDMLQDIETLDKSKIRARIEYLLSDLKK